MSDRDWVNSPAEKERQAFEAAEKAAVAAIISQDMAAFALAISQLRG